MIGASARLTTPRGVQRASALTGVQQLWTGAGWARAAVGPPVEQPLLEVGTVDGRRLRLTPATRVWTATRDAYEPRLPGELQPGDHLAGPLSPADALPAVPPYSSEAYWMGVLVTGALPDSRVTVALRVHVRGPRSEAVYARIRRFAHRRGFRAECGADGSRIAVTFYGSKLDTHFLRKWGFEAGRANHVPTLVWARGAAERKTFCRGLVDGLPLPRIEEKVVFVQATGSDLHDLHTLFVDAGTDPHIAFFDFGQRAGIEIPRWLASWQLGVSGPRPTHIETRRGRIPAAVEYAFLGEPHRAAKKSLVLPRVVARRLEDGEQLHPALLRAAWRALRHTPSEPIFDTPTVEAVHPVFNESSSVEVHIDDPLQRFAVDGLIVDDDQVSKETVR